jgi:hypothetical protein
LNGTAATLGLQPFARFTVSPNEFAGQKPGHFASALAKRKAN